jgi:hypothetical protein
MGGGTGRPGEGHDRTTFLAAYREATQKVRDGVLGVLFPRVTWRMHRDVGFGISKT